MADAQEDTIAGLELLVETLREQVASLQPAAQRASVFEADLEKANSLVKGLQSQLESKDKTIEELRTKAAPSGEKSTVPNLPEGAVQLSRSVTVQNAAFKMGVNAKDGDVLFSGPEKALVALQSKLGSSFVVHPVDKDTLAEVTSLGFHRK